MKRNRNNCRPRITQLENRLTPSTLPPGFAESSLGTVTNGTQMDFSPDGKLYVLEQAGTMKVFQGSGTSWSSNLSRRVCFPRNRINRYLSERR